MIFIAIVTFISLQAGWSKRPYGLLPSNASMYTFTTCWPVDLHPNAKCQARQQWYFSILLHQMHTQLMTAIPYCIHCCGIGSGTC